MKQIDNTKQWKAISNRSLKGGILSSDHIAVFERDRHVIIKAGLRRVLLRLAMLSGFAFLVIAFACYTEVKGDSDSDGGYGECMFMLFFILLAFAFEVLKFLKSGRIDLDKPSETVSIRHGLLFRRRRMMTLSMNDIEVRLYQNRQGNKGREIQWGDLVLALRRVDIDCEELILCKASNVKHLKGPFESMREFLGQGEMSGIDDFIKEDTSKQPLTADRQWHRLAIQSRTKYHLLGGLQPMVSKKENVLNICYSPFAQLMGAGCVILGMAFLLFSLTGFSSLYLTLTCIAITVGFIATAYCVLCRAERVSIDALRSTIRIRHGILFFDSYMEYPLSQVIIKFYRCDRESACASVKTGNTVLSIVQQSAPKDELILYSSTDADYMSSVHDKINRVLGRPVENETEENYELPGGKVINVSRVSIHNSSSSLEIKRTLLESDSEHIIMKRVVSWKNVFAWTWMIPLSFVVLLLIASAMMPEGPIGGILFILISGVVLTGGLFTVWRVVFKYWSRLYFVADGNEKKIFHQFRKDRGKTNLICQFDDVGAVQLCMSHKNDSDKNKGNPVAVYEMNLVLIEPDVRRFSVSAVEDEDQIRKDAELLARFLNVPLIDHI